MSDLFSWLKGLVSGGSKPLLPENVSPVGVIPPTPAARFDACLTELLKHEGGYVDHPKDPGGATNLGITHTTLAAWRGKPVTKADVRALTRNEAGAIYRARYWNAVHGDSLPPGLDLAVFDFAVNSGPGTAAKALQRLLGVTIDGAIGPQTLAAVAKSTAPKILAVQLCDARLDYLRKLPTWSTFGKGWNNRVQAVRIAALAA